MEINMKDLITHWKLTLVFLAVILLFFTMLALSADYHVPEALEVF